MLIKFFVVCSFFCIYNAWAAPKIVEIGIASNFSEISSSSSNPYGNYFRQGIQLALQDYKAKLTKKNLDINIVEFDYGTSQMKVVDVAEKACKSNVSLVLGYVYSSDALLAAPIHQRCRLPLFTPSATANRLAEFSSYIHLGAFNNQFQGKVLAQVAKRKLKAKKALIIYAEDCAYCTDLASAFEAEFKSQSEAVINKIAILSTETDFASVAEKAQALQTEVVLVPNHELFSAKIISALVSKGITKPFLGGDGWGNHGEQFTKMLNGRSIEGYSVSHWFPTIPNSKSKKFILKYQKQFGKMPNDTAVLSYDSMSIVLEALLKEKTISRQSLEYALANLKNFNGVTGNFDFSTGVSPKKDIVLLKAGPSEYKYIKTVEAEK